MAEDFYHIMRYCSLKPDPLFVMETWNLMKENEIPLRGKCYHLAIQALCKRGYIEELAVLQEDRSAVHKIWNECTKMYPMSIIILRKLIWAFTTLKELDSAYEVLQQMVTVTSQCDPRFVQTAEGKLHLARLVIPIPNQLTCDSQEKNSFPTHSLPEDYSIEGTHKSGLSLSKKPFSQHVRRLLRWSFNDLMHLCAKMKKAKLSEKLMLQMQSLGLKPSSATYDGYVRALLSERDYHAGIDQLKVMQRDNMKPHELMLAAISVSCSKAPKLRLAEDLLDQIPICYAYPYNAFIEACYNLGLPKRALRVFAKMKKMNVTPDIKTYELLFKLLGSNVWSRVDTFKRIHWIEMDMKKNDIQHSLVSFQNLMFGLGMEGMRKEMIRYLEVGEEHNDAFAGTPIYDIVLHSLVKAKETDMPIKIFKRMVSRGIPLNAAIYSIMIDCCSVLGCNKSALALVSMMIRSGFPLHRVTYTTLSKVVLSYEDFGEALKLIEMARLDGIQPDVVWYNTILQRASETVIDYSAHVKRVSQGRIDVIKFVVEQMHQEKIQADTSTCAHVICAYIEVGLVTKAMEALKVLSMGMISEKTDILEENKLKYKRPIFREDLEVESKIVGLFRVCADFCVCFD